MFFASATYTVIHTTIAIVGIITGFIALIGMLKGEARPAWTALFLLSTIAASLTGFGFPYGGFLPSHVLGVISLIVLAIALLGFYVYGLAGAWRWIYVVAATIALYLNCFVEVVQAFQKIPSQQEVAATQSELPFAIAQLALLAAFIWLGYLTVKRFR